MLKNSVIESAQTALALPVDFVRKKNGTLCYCVNSRKLNYVTVRDFYSSVRTNENIDSLGDGQVFSTLHANSGFW